jgi:hypothetical protein
VARSRLLEIYAKAETLWRALHSADGNLFITTVIETKHNSFTLIVLFSVVNACDANEDWRKKEPKVTDYQTDIRMKVMQVPNIALS